MRVEQVDFVKDSDGNVLDPAPALRSEGKA
jgi:hypothetical protein